MKRGEKEMDDRLLEAIRYFTDEELLELCEDVKKTRKIYKYILTIIKEREL